MVRTRGRGLNLGHDLTRSLMEQVKWRPPVAPECQPPCGAEKMCASRCVLIGRLKAFGPGSELGVARLRFKSRVPKNELAPMLCDRDVTFLPPMQPSLPIMRPSTPRRDARDQH